ncbi:30S ribosomal protein S17 [Candidatus Uhrbacteria bacterium]|nr:30S ribosomal protein S17 [Candidatus Uhrbacteria bacterium]
MEDKAKANKRTLQGKVVSTKMAKTAVVEVVRTKVHPKYRKQFKVTRKFKVHDEKGECRIGDKVRFEETKPISKDKRWRLVGKAKAA